MPYIENEITISNQALTSLNRAPINSLDDLSKEGKACKRFFDEARRTTLNFHPWNFSLAQVELSRDLTAPLIDFRYRYQLPADFVRINKIQTDNKFRIIGEFLHTDDEIIILEYVKDTTDISKFPPYIVSLIIEYLKYKLSKPLTGAYIPTTQYEKLLANAKYTDSSEDFQEHMPITETFYNSRF